MRIRGLDVLRGAAIILMILDHVIDVFHIQRLWFLRVTVTRAAMPVFMLVAGYLWAAHGTPRWQRLADLVMAAFAAGFLTFTCGMRELNILTTFVPVAIGAPLIVEYPGIAAAIGVIQAYAWPLPISGYPPGNLVTLTALGVLLQRCGWQPAYRGTRIELSLERVGRRPLTWYLGHLTILAIIKGSS